MLNWADNFHSLNVFELTNIIQLNNDIPYKLPILHKMKRSKIAFRALNICCYNKCKEPIQNNVMPSVVRFVLKAVNY